MKKLLRAAAILAATALLSACGAADTDRAGDEASGNGTSASDSQAAYSEDVTEKIETEYTNEDGITFKIVRAEDIWTLAGELHELSNDEERPDEMFVQIDVIAGGNYTAFDNSNGLKFKYYTLTDLADGTPRRMELLGTLLSDEKYSDAAYASGATLDEETLNELSEQWDTFEEYDRVTVRGKLIRANFTDRYHVGDEEAQHYEVYMAVMELEAKENRPVSVGSVAFEAVSDPRELWALCEMNADYGGYLPEQSYVELELEVAENTNGEVKFTSWETGELPDGNSGKIDLKGVVYKHSEVLERRQLVGAAVSDATYDALVKRCGELSVGDKVTVKGCLLVNDFNVITQVYDARIAIIGIDVK